MAGALRERATNSDRQKECDQFADVAIARFKKWRVPATGIDRQRGVRQGSGGCTGNVQRHKLVRITMSQ